MKEFTIELKKIDDRRSLVVWVTPGGNKKFVVCSYYDHEKPVGSQWAWGHYFTDLWAAVEYAREETDNVHVSEKDADCISRQDAIMAMYAMVDECARDDPYRENPHIDAIVDTLENLTPAQPERKMGKWIVYDWNTYRCSCCGKQIITNPDYIKEHKFCFGCGADMRTKETDYDYERAVEQLEHDILYEPTFNQDDGSM